MDFIFYILSSKSIRAILHEKVQATKHFGPNRRNDEDLPSRSSLNRTARRARVGYVSIGKTQGLK